MVAQQTIFDDRVIDDSYLLSANQGKTHGLATTVVHGIQSGRGTIDYHAWWHVADLFGDHDGSGVTLGATATITDAYFEVVLSSVVNDLSGAPEDDATIYNAPTGCTAMGHYVEETVTWCAGATCYNTIGGCIGVGVPVGGNLCLECVKWAGGPGHVDHPFGDSDAWSYDSTLSAGSTMQISVTNCVQYAVDSATSPGELHLFAEDKQVADTQRYTWHSVQGASSAQRPILVVNWDDGVPIPPSPISSTNSPKFVLSHNATIIADAAIDATSGMAFTTSANLKSTTEAIGDSSIALSTVANLSSKNAIAGESSLLLSGSADAISTVSISSSAPIILSTTTDIQASASVSSSASMVFTSSADLTSTKSIDSDANLVLSSSADISATANIYGGSLLPGMALSGSAAQSAIGSISSSAPIVLSGSAELTSRTNIAGNSLDMVLTTDANITATTSIYGGVSLPGFVFTGSAAQSAIGSISSSASMVFGATAELTHVLSTINVSATAGMVFSSNAPILTNSTPITELAGLSKMAFSTSLANVVSLFDPGSINIVLTVDNANLRDSQSIKPLVSLAPIILFAGKGQGGTGIALRDAFRWLTDSTEPTSGVELCPYTPFTLRTKFDTLEGGITFGDKFEDLKDAGLTVGWDTGIISGNPTELDTYVGLFAVPEGQQVDEQSYATYGSAALFDATGNSVSHGITFIGQATLHNPIVAPDATYLASELPLTIEREFFIPIYNNWSSDRDQLALTLNTPLHQTYISGNETTPADFLAAMKTQGYYGNVCVPVTMPKSVNKPIALNTKGDLTDPSAHAASTNKIVVSLSATLHNSSP